MADKDTTLMTDSGGWQSKKKGLTAYVPRDSVIMANIVGLMINNPTYQILYILLNYD
jgi:hypothetical protein